MSLIKLLLEKYPEDRHSKELKGDPVEDVYYLTSRDHLPRTIVYHQGKSFFGDYHDEYPENAEQVMKAVGVSTYNGIWFDTIYEEMDSIPDNLIDHMVKFVEKDIEKYYHELPEKFTSNALEFRNVLHNEWLVHFSDYAYNIMDEGFNKGVDDPKHLSLTTHMSDRAKEIGGFNFAYRQDDAHRYGHRGGYSDKPKYGEEAVLFQVPKAILCDHWGDQEPQVIFWGSMAENITYIQYEEYYIEESDLYYHVMNPFESFILGVIRGRHEMDEDAGDPEFEEFFEGLEKYENITGVEDIDINLDDYDIQTQKGWPNVNDFESIWKYVEELNNIHNALRYYFNKKYEDHVMELTCIQHINGKETVVYRELMEDMSYVDLVSTIDPNNFKTS